MLTFNNTLEAEQNRQFRNSSATTPVHIIGGLSKEKYNDDYYFERTTYSKAQLDMIISSIKEIEREINPNWSEIQKAYYVYVTLGKKISYDYNHKEHPNIPSNLYPLINGKGICAGYSLVFKEIMDRLGIKCDYMRGIGAKKAKHAWNALTIGNATIAVDLTWDAAELQKGASVPQFFGQDNFEFYEDHDPDPDEQEYFFSKFSKDQLENLHNSIFSKQNIEKQYRKSQPPAPSATVVTPAQIISRKYGSKIAVTPCGSKYAGETRVYKYVISECSNGRMSTPRIIYSENDINNLSKKELSDFATGLLDPSRLVRYFEHCEDNLRDFPDSQSFENHGGYVGYMENGRKKANPETANHFQNNFVTMYRDDNTSFVLQETAGNESIKRLGLKEYKMYEMATDSVGNPVLVRNIIYSETDFLHQTNISKGTIASSLLPRDRVDEKCASLNGYVGCIAPYQDGTLRKTVNEKTERALEQILSQTRDSR